MDEQTLLSRLRHGDEQALAAAITQYSAYVVTVIHNRSRGLLSPEDEDELASTVFFALWQSCQTVKAGHLRAWLGSVARNKTVDRLRKSRCEVPLDEDLAGTEDFLLEIYSPVYNLIAHCGYMLVQGELWARAYTHNGKPVHGFTEIFGTQGK